MNKQLCFLLSDGLFQVLSTIFVFHQVVEVIFQQIKRLPKVHFPQSVENFKHFFVVREVIQTSLQPVQRTIRENLMRHLIDR